MDKNFSHEKNTDYQDKWLNILKKVILENRGKLKP